MKTSSTLPSSSFLFFIYTLDTFADVVGADVDGGGGIGASVATAIVIAVVLVHLIISSHGVKPKQHKVGSEELVLLVALS